MRAGALLLVVAAGLPAQEQDPVATSSPLLPYVAAIRRATADADAQAGGDALLDEALRSALAVSRGATDRAAACGHALVALCWFADPTTPITRNPFWRRRFRGLETREQARTRSRLAARFTLRGRRDLALHFLTSAALRVLAGRAVALQAGVGKELADAHDLDRGDGTGFSFADLCADEAGLAFAELLLEKDGLARIRADVSLTSHMPIIEGLAEGIGMARWRELYGGVADPRFQSARESVRRRVRQLSQK